MSGHQQGLPEQPMAAPAGMQAGVPQMAAMAPGQFPWMPMQGGFDPAMMQQAASMMATLQQQQQQLQQMQQMQQPQQPQQQQPQQQQVQQMQPPQQQGQFAHPGTNPQMYYAAMQMPGGQPMAGMPSMAPGMMMPGAQVPAVASTTPAPEGQGGGRDFAGDFRNCAESLGQVEREYYTFLWEAAGCANSQSLEGKPAVDFLSKSMLQKDMLKRIWNLADWQKRHCLGWQEFVVTMKLVSAAQKKQVVSLERVLENCSPNSMDCPEFQGIANASAFKATSAPPQRAELPATTPADPLAMDLLPAPAAPPEDPASRPAEGGHGGPVGLEGASLGFGGAPAPAPAGDEGKVLIGDASAGALGGDFGALQPPAAAEPLAGLGGSPSGNDMSGMLAFGLGGAATGAPSAAAAPSAAPLPPEPSKVESPESGALPASGDAWADFAAPPDDRPPASGAAAPGEGWADFAPAAQQPSSAAADATWADFESAAAPDAAAGAPPSGPASTSPEAAAPGQNDRWSKMSAFDDLMKEDDALGGSAAAAGLGEAFAAEATTAPPVGLPSMPQPPLLTDGPALEGKADDDWGDFATAGADFPAPAAAGSPPGADAFDADFGDFSGGGGSGEGFGAFDMGPGDGSGGLLGSAAEGAKVGGTEAAGSSAAPAEADPWGGFASPASAGPGGGAPSPGPDSLGASVDFFGEAAAAPAGGVKADAFGDAFKAGFDDEEFTTGAVAAAGDSPLGSDPGLVPSPKEAEISWAAFPAPSGQLGAAAGGDAGKAAGAAGGAVGSANVADWAAFDFGAPGPEAAGTPPAAAEAGSGPQEADMFGAALPAAASGAAAAPLSFDDEGDLFKDGGGKAAAAPVLPLPQAGGSPLARTAPPAASWDAFGAEDDVMPKLKAPAALLAPPGAAGGDAGRGALRLPPPGPSAVAAAAPAAAQPADADVGDDGEFSRIARSLASLGLFDEAERCWAHAKVLKQLEKAEERKREAAAKDDFEGAIKSRDEIKALTAELAPQQSSEGWRRLSTQGQRDSGLEEATERLRQRCQYLDDAFARAAVCAAVANFRCAWPSTGSGGDLGALQGLALQRRKAQQMSRAIEAVVSTNVLHYLNVLTASLSSLAEVLQSCEGQLQHIALPEWSREERELVCEAADFQDFLRGLGGLRRTMWRISLSAELFLPSTTADPGSKGILDVGELPDSEAAKLRELQAGVGQHLDAVRGAWARTEAGLAGLNLQLGPWKPGEFFEVGGGTGIAAGAHRSAPICGLCLLPTLPFGVEVPDDGIASVLFKGGLWHAQCANFWVMHGATSKAFKDTGIADPFAQSQPSF